MSEMNARLQQFFDANAQHSINFLWLKVRTMANHPAEDGIMFSVIVARPAHKSAAMFEAVNIPPASPANADVCQRNGQITKAKTQSNLYFQPFPF
jgi:hypothetical protein